MPVLKFTHGDSGRVFTLGDADHPFGEGGVDLSANAATLSPSYLARSENADLTDDVVARRNGAKKTYKASDATGSKTFGTTAKYALIPAASQLLIPAGGFAFVGHFVPYALEVPLGDTSYIVGARPSGQSYHVFKVTNTDSGTVVVSWRTSAGATHSITLTGVTAIDSHLVAYYDAAAGTFTCYLNGAVSGTPITGLASTLQPAQDSGVAWTFGVEKETGSAVTANTAFPNACDDFVLFRNPPPVAMLLKHSARGWPNPMDDRVLFHYSFDGSSTTVLTDHSWFKNHATLAGTPSNTAAVALSSMNSNHIGSIGRPDGSRVNLFGSHGRLFYEPLRSANS